LKNFANNDQAPILAVDAMGGDEGPQAVVEGVANALARGLNARFLLFGDGDELTRLAKKMRIEPRVAIRHSDNVVFMKDKPSHVIRRGRDTSMWKAMEAHKNGEAQALVSCGNTGALMALARLQLRMIEGIDRPAISALWPTKRGQSVVLDVGANVEADEKQLVQFAIMGEAFYRVLNGVEKPSVGLLNVGAEDLKGHELIRTAASTLREAVPSMAFIGFVEGDDISEGATDVVVTDGFTGNIALKSAEGTARLVGGWMKDALSGTPNARFGAMFMASGLRKLKDRMDPSSVNGGVFLGINGIVVKSHGSSDARAVESALKMAHRLACQPFQSDIAQTVRAVMDRRRALSGGPQSRSADAEADECARADVKAAVQ
jgi:glycerol-3-phosphate acyltransferase PlsX